jgi:hypothetical protein
MYVCTYVFTAKKGSEKNYSKKPIYGHTKEMELGHTVSVRGQEGVVKYIGEVHYAKGQWVGIEVS